MDAVPVTIKKYANRRLYNMATSSYVTLDDLAAMVRSGTDFNVIDAKSGEDITRGVLTQIIVEAESAGGAMLPVPFLRDLIRAYGQSAQGVLPSYLELAMRGFAETREHWMAVLTPGAPGAGGAQGLSALTPMELMRRSMQANLEFMASATRSLVPRTGGQTPDATVQGSAAVSSRSGEGTAAELAALKAQLATIQNKLDRLG
jgi:polyhydroxyalkanoate synthesis repressor PhaR